MLVKDEIYGEMKVSPVIEELILSPSIQRLKNVHMAGASFLVNPIWNETRYEHSVGVMMLVAKLGGGIEEQIAALLHDVSHTAFSHTMDVVLGNEDENYHDSIRSLIVDESSIPGILKEHGFDASILDDEEQFYILEKDAPKLCADRIDYTLRAAHRYFNVSVEDIHVFLSDLIVFDREICINNIDVAEWFTKVYGMIVVDFFYDPDNVMANSIMKDIIRYSFSKKLIDVSDFMLDDYNLISKLIEKDNNYINEKFSLFNAKHRCIVSSSDSDYTVFWKAKERYVDPSVIVSNKKHSSSSLSDKVVKEIERAKQVSKVGLYLNITFD